MKTSADSDRERGGRGQDRGGGALPLTPFRRENDKGDGDGKGNSNGYAGKEVVGRNSETQRRGGRMTGGC